MEADVIIRSWRPWRLFIDRIGPFRESIERVAFLDGQDDLANLYMLASGNGRGKTTILESICFAMRLLAPDFPNRADLHHDIVAERDGRLQLDVIVEMEIGQVSRPILLSLSWGDVGTNGLAGWQESPLEDGRADRWLRYGGRNVSSGHSNPTLRREQLPLPADPNLHGWDTVEEAEQWMRAIVTLIDAGHDLAWPGFNQGGTALPTVLYFAADRGILHHVHEDHALGRPTTPRYQPAHRFDRDGQNWFGSLDNLLVWYFWVSPADFKEASDFINQMVFGGDDAKRLMEEPERDPPRMLVMSGGSVHPLGKLSSGEKSLVQLALRVGAHRTSNTIILLDELELHLHPDFQRRVVQFFKNLVARERNIHVIFTTHSREVMSEFEFESQEEGLRKGGELLLP